MVKNLKSQNKRGKKTYNDQLKQMVVKLRLEKGWKFSDIENFTKVPHSTTHDWVKLYEQNNEIFNTPKLKNNTLWKEHNSKITKYYVRELKKLCTKKNDELYDKERCDLLQKKTGISLSRSRLTKLRNQLNFTSKVKTYVYPDSENFKNQKALEKWKNLHDGIKGGFITWRQAMSTDEKKFTDIIVRKKAVAKIIKKHKRRNRCINLIFGNSFRNNASRAMGYKPKRHSVSVHCCASISMHPNYPLVHIETKIGYFNGSEFAHFLQNKKEPPFMITDIIDRSSVHRCEKANLKRGDKPIKIIYSEKNILEDFIPTGFPYGNPIEQFWNWLDKKIQALAPTYAPKGKWDPNVLMEIIHKEASKLTHNEVKGFYRNSYKQMYQNDPRFILPAYLRE